MLSAPIDPHTAAQLKTTSPSPSQALEDKFILDAHDAEIAYLLQEISQEDRHEEAAVASIANASGNNWDNDDTTLCCLKKAEDSAFSNEFTVNEPLNSAQEMVVAKILASGDIISSTAEKVVRLEHGSL